MTENTDIE